MKKTLAFLTVLLALPLLLRANGDPVISYSADIRSCNPVPLKVSEVQVVREDLRIDVGLPYTSVRVQYQLKNNSVKDIHVDYGFPVDFSGKMGVPHSFDGDDWTESMYEAGIGPYAVKEVHFALDGKELDWTHSDTVVKTGESYEDEETGETIEVQRCRLWTYTALDIPAGQQLTLEVRYQVLCSWTVPLNSLRVSPLSRYFPSDGQFDYDFTPAQHWGNGKAGTFSATVSCSALPKAFFNKESPQFYPGEPFTRSNNSTWSCNVSNFDFASADPIRVLFWKAWDEKAPYVRWGDPLKDCAIPASQYRVKVSGAQDNYPVGNLSDDDLSTAWVAPGDGVGATVDIDFAKPQRISDICLYNGYHKSASLWSSNSRIAKVRLEVTRADGTVDEPAEIDLTDWDERYYTLRDDREPRFGEPAMISVTDLRRQAYGRLLPDPEIEYAYIYDKVPEEADLVAHIRLTVLEVVPGTRYKDLCVSSLVLLDGFKEAY